MEWRTGINNGNLKLFHARLVWSLSVEYAEDEKTKHTKQPSDKESECERESGDQDGELSGGKLEKMTLGNDTVPFGIAAHERAKVGIGHLCERNFV